MENLNKDEYYRMLIISIFLLMLKPFMVITLIIPIFLFIINKKKKIIIENKNKFFCLIFISIWLLKNLLTSSCVIFPLKQTCFNNLIYSNTNIVNTASIEAEAWAKGYPDAKIKNSYEEYNSNFNWLKTWTNNHFKKIVEKILPLLILIIILFYFL